MISQVCKGCIYIYLLVSIFFKLFPFENAVIFVIVVDNIFNRVPCLPTEFCHLVRHLVSNCFWNLDTDTAYKYHGIRNNTQLHKQLFLFVYVFLHSALT